VTLYSPLCYEPNSDRYAFVTDLSPVSFFDPEDWDDTSYKIVFNILLSRLSPYIDEIIGDHQCEFRRNRSTTDEIFSIRQVLEKKYLLDMPEILEIKIWLLQ
jgi:hypothetical protein